MLRLPAAHVASIRQRLGGRRVLVTGGAGFIGGHLVDALLGVGASVTVIDDLSTSTSEHLGELIDLDPDRLRFVQGSILDPSALGEAAADAKLVFHLAALGSVQRSVENPQRSWDVNASGTVRVFEAARSVGAERVVLAASSSAYGDTEELPKVETMRANPRSPYAASKLAAEHVAAAWPISFDMDAVSLRYFNVFGPRQPADSAYAAVIPAFAARMLKGQRPVIFGDGEQSRDFTFVANVVLATLLAGASEKKLAGSVINIGGGERTDLLTLADKIAGSVGHPELRPEHRETRAGDVRHSLASLDRAKSVLGYEPFVTVAQGLEQTIEAMRGMVGTSASGG